MFNAKQVYILDKPIDTEIGACHFAKVIDYDKILIYQEWINRNKEDVLNVCKKAMDSILREDERLTGEELLRKLKDNEKFIECIKDLQLIEIIKNVKQLGIYKLYNQMFEFFFKEDVFDRVNTDEELFFYINLFREMNCIKSEKKNINPEIAYFEKLLNMTKERQGDVLTLKSIITNVGLYRPDVLDMSIYSLYAYFETIANNKNYNTGNLFSTVSTKPIDIKPWYADTVEEFTEFNEEDKQYINRGMNFAKNIPLDVKNKEVF